MLLNFVWVIVHTLRPWNTLLLLHVITSLVHFDSFRGKNTSLSSESLRMQDLFLRKSNSLLRKITLFESVRENPIIIGSSNGCFCLDSCHTPFKSVLNMHYFFVRSLFINDWQVRKMNFLATLLVLTCAQVLWAEYEIVLIFFSLFLRHFFTPCNYRVTWKPSHHHRYSIASVFTSSIFLRFFVRQLQHFCKIWAIHFPFV